jgi:hypothetical protein
MGKYKHLRSQCSWEVQENRAMLASYSSFETYSAGQLLLLTNEIEPEKYGPPPLDYSIERCCAHLPNGSTLLIDRVAVTSHPGSWVTYHWLDVGLTSQYVPASVTRAFTGAVDSNGDVIGYPPLEMHHLHVGPDLKSTLLFQSHTDTQCTAEDGGTDCLLWSIPDGYGLHFDKLLNTFGTIADVRPHGPPLQFYIEVGIVLTTQDVGAIAESSITNPYLARNFITHGTDTYIHDAALTSLMWFSAEIPNAGSFIMNPCHSHWDWTSELLVFKARPSQLGLTHAPSLQPVHPWVEIDLERAGYSVNQVRALLFGSLAEAQHTLHGRAKPGFVGACSPLWEDDKINATSVHFKLPRSPMLPNFHVDKGDVLTVVAFHHPINDKAARAGMVRMHSVFGGALVRDDGGTSYDYMKGAQDPSWTWIGFFGGFEMYEVFRAQGGPFAPQRQAEKHGMLWKLHANLMALSEILVEGSSVIVDMALFIVSVALCGCCTAKIFKGLKATCSKHFAASKMMV